MNGEAVEVEHSIYRVATNGIIGSCTCKDVEVHLLCGAELVCLMEDRASGVVLAAVGIHSVYQRQHGSHSGIEGKVAQPLGFAIDWVAMEEHPVVAVTRADGELVGGIAIVSIAERDKLRII